MIDVGATRDRFLAAHGAAAWADVEALAATIVDEAMGDVRYLTRQDVETSLVGRAAMFSVAHQLAGIAGQSFTRRLLATLRAALERRALAEAGR